MKRNVSGINFGDEGKNANFGSIWKSTLLLLKKTIGYQIIMLHWGKYNGSFFKTKRQGEKISALLTKAQAALDIEICKVSE
jgi:hypothetical protein